MHSEPESEFARILTGIQKRTGLSHLRIAEAAGVDRSQVWRWVRAGSNPGYEPVRRLAAWLVDEHPEVADDAASLLPAAGYEKPPGALPLGAEEFARVHGVDPLNPFDPFIRDVNDEIERAERIYGKGATGIQVFHGGPAAEIEAMVLDAPGVSREAKVVAIATLRASRARESASPVRRNAGLIPLLTLAGR